MYVDTNILIYLLENHGAYSERVAQILEESAVLNEKLITSTITITEFLAGTTSSKLATLQMVPGLAFIELDENLAEQAAMLQRGNNLQIGDAIHLASALQEKATTFFTNDRPFANIAKKYLPVRHL